MIAERRKLSRELIDVLLAWHEADFDGIADAYFTRIL